MEPLTIEELKALPVGDWVWCVYPEETVICGEYAKKHKPYKSCLDVFALTDNAILLYIYYGTKWVAYKNKEFAETKGEIVELSIRLVSGDGGWYIHRQNIFEELFFVSKDKEQAKRRLAELKGEQK